MWTHLTNIMESSDPLKQGISDILTNERLAKDFDLDKRKFSRNMEWSLFSTMLNTGATIDSDIIFSEKSFVPRSANLNLTLNMFGHAVNFVEVGGRVEGLESMLEKLFGSHMNNDDMRSKRSLIDTDDISVLDGRYDATRDSPKASMYVKMFGNEIRYEDFHSMDAEQLQDKFNYMAWMMKLSENQNYEMTKNSVILDASFALPTIAGMPMKLIAEGSYTMNLKMNGRVDLRGVMADTKKIDILGSIEPRCVSTISHITSARFNTKYVAKLTRIYCVL